MRVYFINDSLERFCLRGTTLRFDILHSFMVCTQTSAFQIHWQTGDQSTKMSFFSCLRFIFACRLVLRTDHKRVKNLETQCCSVTQTMKDYKVHSVYASGRISFILGIQSLRYFKVARYIKKFEEDSLTIHGYQSMSSTNQLQINTYPAVLYTIEKFEIENFFYPTLNVRYNIFIKITRLSTTCLLYTSPSPRDKRQSRMPSSA